MAQRSSPSSTKVLPYETIMNMTDGIDPKSDSTGRGAPALSSRLVTFRAWLEENQCVVHPAVCIVNGEATDGTKNAPVLVFGPPTSVTAGVSSTSGASSLGNGGTGGGGMIGTSTTDKTHGRCGLIDTDLDRVLYDRTMGCQVRTVKEMKKDDVMMKIPRSLFITPDLIASSDAGKAVLACCRPPNESEGATLEGFWDVFVNTTEREKKFLEKISQNTGTQLLVKILQERKRVETTLNKAAKDLEDADFVSSEAEKIPEYKLIDRDTLSTRAPILAFLIHQRFSNQLKPPVSTLNRLEKITTKPDAYDKCILPPHSPPNWPSTFAPYARTLPPSVPLPICWKRNELALLAGCIPGLSILQEIVAQTMALASDLTSLIEAGLHFRFPSIFSKNMITWDRWLWAASVHTSRILPSSCYYNNGVKSGYDHIPSPGEMFLSPPHIWDELGVMIPLLDMLNHESNNAQVNLESPRGPTTVVDESSIQDMNTNGEAKVIINKRVKKGSELYTSYGLESNKEWILRYGFAQISNIVDTVSVGWGFNDCVGGVPPPSDYIDEHMSDFCSTDQAEKWKKHLLFESSDQDAINAWWTESRISLLENQMKAHALFFAALRSGKKMSSEAHHGGTFDPVLLTAVVVATLPRTDLSKHLKSLPSDDGTKAITISKLHQYVIRKYLMFFFSRKIERLLQSLSNGLKDHFNQIKLWTKITDGGLSFLGKDDSSSVEKTGCIGWQAFFDAFAYMAAVEVEKKYYSIAPESCVLTLYDGHLKSLQSSIQGVLSDINFSSTVLKQLEDLGFVVSIEHTPEEEMMVDEEIIEKDTTDTKPFNVNSSEESKHYVDDVSVASATERRKDENTAGNSPKNDGDKRDRNRNKRNRNRKGSGPSTIKLHLGNLAYQTTQSDLREYFSTRYGRDNVLECHIPTERDTGRSRGFGFVTMPEAVSLRVLHSDIPHEIDGRIIKIAESNTSSSSRGANPLPKGPIDPLPKGPIGGNDRCINCGYRPRYCTCSMPSIPGNHHPPHYGGMPPPPGAHAPMHMMPYDDMYGEPNPGMMGNYMPSMMGPYNPEVGYYGRGPNPEYDRPGRHRSRSWNRDRSDSRSPSRHRGSNIREDMMREQRHYDMDHRDRGLHRSYSRSRSPSYSRNRRSTRDSERESSRRSSRRHRRSSGSRDNGESSRYRSRSRSSGSDSRSGSYSSDESVPKRHNERDRNRERKSSLTGAIAQDLPTTTANNPSSSKGSDRNRSRSNSMPPQAREHEQMDHEKSKRESSKRSRSNRSRSASRERSSRKRKRSSKGSRRSKSKYRSPSSSSSDSSR